MNQKTVLIAFVSVVALFSVFSFASRGHEDDGSKEPVQLVWKAHWENI